MMPPLHTVLKSVSLFLLIYIFLTAVSTVPQVQRALGTAFGQACLLVAESGFEDMTFRVKPNRNEGRYEYGIRLLYFSDAAIEQARQEAMARGDSRAAVAPPSVVTLELYTFLLVPLFFLWALQLATPPLRLATFWTLLPATALFLAYLALRVLVVFKAAINPSTLYTTLAEMLSMGVNMLVALIIWGLLLITRKSFIHTDPVGPL